MQQNDSHFDNESLVNVQILVVTIQKAYHVSIKPQISLKPKQVIIN